MTRVDWFPVPDFLEPSLFKTDDLIVSQPEAVNIPGYRMGYSCFECGVFLTNYPYEGKDGGLFCTGCGLYNRIQKVEK